MSAGPPRVRRRLVVQGRVQGVGFRPFVHRAATGLGLDGWVRNTPEGVVVEVEGAQGAVDAFAAGLAHGAPALADVTGVAATPLRPTGAPGFRIAPSAPPAPGAAVIVAPDIATCPECLAEVRNPVGRRHRYPFTTCAACGPRFTITRALPYDRASTTMAGFTMCAACRAEYEDPADRRFHAQPIACPACGPVLRLVTGPGAGAAAEGDAALGAARRLLAEGAVVAVKGVGGVHLACDAVRPECVATLRRRKARPDRPFALMVRDLATARTLADVDDAAAAVLGSWRAPIVLLRRRPGAPVAREVAPGMPDLGLMLPYSPLHHLLLEAGPDGAPEVLVMTSGNRADEPIAFRDDDALGRLAGLADAFLLHDRPIHVPCDDSVVRVHRGRALPVRRSRGHAPLPVHLPAPGAPSVLAAGGDMKGAVALTRGRWAVMSQHLGDMGDLAGHRAAHAAAEHLQGLLGMVPAAVACDLHPGYHSARAARELAAARGLPLVEVQHHHAHVAAVMAEHGLDGAEPVVGVALDGTGYGPGGAAWGGEVLVCDRSGARRVGHLAPVPLPGGDAAVIRPYRTALAHLRAAGVGWAADLHPVRACDARERAAIARQTAGGPATAPTTSAGRLLDAVASIAGVRQVVTYEAQAALELEARAAAAWPADPYPLPARAGDPVVLDPGPLVRAVVADVRRGVEVERIAARVHAALAHAFAGLAVAAARRAGAHGVALTGGVFHNVLLLDAATGIVEGAGLRVLTHALVPPGDGGLALGQALVAAWRLGGDGG